MHVAGPYEIIIPEGNHRPDGTVGMNHNQQYSVLLKNHTSQRVNVHLSIDGQLVDKFRLGPRSNWTIETKPGSEKRFTFAKLRTSMAIAGQVADNANTGLVTTTFIPEIVRPESLSFGVRGQSMTGQHTKAPVSAGRRLESGEPDAAGGTVLTGRSNQQFRQASPMELDHERKVTIHLRLVCQGNDVQPLHSTIPPRPVD